MAPILQKLLLNREPEQVMRWVDAVCAWPFQRIIPCHLANDLKAGPRDFRAAFDFLYESDEPRQRESWLDSVLGKSKAKRPRPLDADLALLNNASKLLTDLGVVFPEAPKLKR